MSNTTLDCTISTCVGWYRCWVLSLSKAVVVPQVDGNKETKGEDRNRQSRNKLLEVIRTPFLRTDA